MTAMRGGEGNPEIDVSVLLITYNHAAFVRDAADSVLSQRTDRSFELIVSEDASSDGTREIVQELAKRDARVRLLLSSENLRSNEPVKRALDAARGRYVCILDGDDRWLVDDKIERQANLLDDRLDLCGCFHNALVARGSAAEPTNQRWTASTLGPRVTFAELWNGNPFATCAGMLRKSALRTIPGWYVDCFPITDWPLYLRCAEQGDLLFVDEPVGLYRLHCGGEVSGLAEQAQLRLIARFYRQVAAACAKWRDLARRRGFLFFIGKARQFIGDGDAVAARHALRLALEAGGARRMLSRTWLRLAWRSVR